jgi:EmrB/QacA subfamily drug resistance transporter
MSALDASIVSALLPVVGRALHASVAGIEWVVTVYLLVISGVLLGLGRLGDLHGHKGVYVGGFAGFMISSGLCGLAPTAAWLIFFRVLQAVAAAMLFANSPAILTSTFPAAERGRALGLQSTMTYLGLSVGAPLGGILTVHFGWRSIFFVNVPVAALGLYLSRRVITRDRPEGRTPPFDRLGATLFFLGIFALLLALNRGYVWGWGAPPTLGLVAGALAALSGFLVVERGHPHPMLDLSLFRRRAFAGSVFSSLMSYVAHNAILFLLPFYLVAARGLDPEHAGLVFMAEPLLMMLTSPIAGTLSDRFGSRRLTTLGLCILVTGILLLSQAGPATPLGSVVTPLAVCGLGLGCFIAPNNSRLLGAAPRQRQGIASGVMAAARNVGMVVGVGIAGAVYTTVVVRTGPAGVSQGVSSALKVIGALTVVPALTSWLEGEAPAEV